MSNDIWRERKTTIVRSETAQEAITGAPWLALLKFSGGEWNLTAAEREALLACGLIEATGSGSMLTLRGRQALRLAP